MDIISIWKELEKKIEFRCNPSVLKRSDYTSYKEEMSIYGITCPATSLDDFTSYCMSFHFSAYIDVLKIYLYVCYLWEQIKHSR